MISESHLSEFYRNYIACLNAQDWSILGKFIGDGVTYNGKKVGMSGYRQMLEKDFCDIPDLHFHIQLLICEPPTIASRLQFDCRPIGVFLGIPVNGKRIVFAENVFYEIHQGKIDRVWSIIDKAVIEAQLSSNHSPR